MSVKFSKPLTGYWEKFLHIYRNEELSRAVLPRGNELSSPERARRYHEWVVEDANRQISVMMALVQTLPDSEESLLILTEESERLNSHERNILADSFASETSE